MHIIVRYGAQVNVIDFNSVYGQEARLKSVTVKELLAVMQAAIAHLQLNLKASYGWKFAADEDLLDNVTTAVLDRGLLPAEAYNHVRIILSGEESQVNLLALTKVFIAKARQSVKLRSLSEEALVKAASPEPALPTSSLLAATSAVYGDKSRIPALSVKSDLSALSATSAAAQYANALRR